MRIQVSTADGVPIYLQIINQIKYQISSGVLRPGDEMPPIRTLAETLMVNPNTVARAYRELQQVGLLENKRTAGTYVSQGESPLSHQEKRRILEERIDSLLTESHQLRVPFATVLEWIKERQGTFPKPTRQGDQA